MSAKIKMNFPSEFNGFSTCLCLGLELAFLSFHQLLHRSKAISIIENCSIPRHLLSNRFFKYSLFVFWGIFYPVLSILAVSHLLKNYIQL